MNVVDLLEAAHADYAEHGWAVGSYQGHDPERGICRCALGSLRYVLSDANGMTGQNGNAHPLPEQRPVYREACRLLDESAQRLYDARTIVLVNDDHGRDQVLACYQAAIAAAREQVTNGR